MVKKILVVDDDPQIVKTLKSCLEKAQYRVIIAYNGQEALEAVSKETPDLVILDIIMPKMDGYTFVRKFKFDKAVKHVPVLILTAKETMRDLFEMEGVTDYTIKPFKETEILEKVKKHLGLSD